MTKKPSRKKKVVKLPPLEFVKNASMRPRPEAMTPDQGRLTKEQEDAIRRRLNSYWGAEADDVEALLAELDRFRSAQPCAGEVTKDAQAVRINVTEALDKWAGYMFSHGFENAWSKTREKILALFKDPLP